MRVLFLLVVLGLIFCANQSIAYDSNLNQKVKYNQQRAKWKIKEAKERMKKRRSSTSNYGSRASSSSSRSRATSRSRASSRTPRVSATRSLQTFMIAANRSTRLEQLYPYALKKKREYWQRLSPKAKQKELLRLKKWTYGAQIVSEEAKPMVATVKIRGTAKGVHLWNENGVWKFSDVF